MELNIILCTPPVMYTTIATPIHKTGVQCIYIVSVHVNSVKFHRQYFIEWQYNVFCFFFVFFLTAIICLCWWLYHNIIGQSSASGNAACLSDGMLSVNVRVYDEYWNRLNTVTVLYTCSSRHGNEVKMLNFLTISSILGISHIYILDQEWSFVEPHITFFRKLVE